MEIKRIVLDQIHSRMFSGKVILLFGPRQAGKTTLLRALIPKQEDALWLNGDLPAHHRLLDEPTPERIGLLLNRRKILCIDEAQRITDIGLKLKILNDGLPDVQIIATGSSSFELAHRTGEPLTGRKWEYRLFPLSFGEMAVHSGVLKSTRFSTTAWFLAITPKSLPIQAMSRNAYRYSLIAIYTKTF